MDIPFRTLTVEEAEKQLADKALDVQDTAEALATSESALSDAHAADSSADVILKAEANLQKSKDAHARAIKAHDAAEKRLNHALDANNAKLFHEAEKKRDAALKARINFAQVIDRTAKERAAALKLWQESDKALAECKRDGAVSKNAAPSMQYGNRRALTLVEMADARAGLPGTEGKFKLSYSSREAIPSAVQQVKSDNQTIVGK